MECKKGDRSPHVSLALNLAMSDTSLPDDASVQLPILSLRLSSTLVRSYVHVHFRIYPVITRDTDMERAGALIYTQTTTATLSSRHASIRLPTTLSIHKIEHTLARTHVCTHAGRRTPRGCAVCAQAPQFDRRATCLCIAITLTLQFMRASTARGTPFSSPRSGTADRLA